MSASSLGALRHALLDACGVEHGFGVRGSKAPQGSLLPKQVHGIQVAIATSAGGLEPTEADAVVCTVPAQGIGVITADCVPILASSREGSGVAAIHAGWRGLAAGVVARGIAELAARVGAATELVAVIGPSIGGCCYEVDSPVLSALEARFPQCLRSATRAARPGHAYLDLSALVRIELERCGLQPGSCAAIPDACTRCDARRFHSYRRDGAAAGRLVHHIAAC